LIVTGYSLRAKVAASPRQIEPDDRGPGGTSISVSLEPYATARDSSLWHGAIDPLVEVYFLDPRPFVRAHAQTLFGWNERLADSANYYTPGTWVLYHDGRLLYRYELRSGSTLLYSVRAERVSRETLGEYLRQRRP
jgi:hypothetical protein